MTTTYTTGAPKGNVAPLQAMLYIASLELLRARRGNAIKAAVVLLGLLVVAVGLGAVFGDGDSGTLFQGISRSLLPFAAMVASVLFATRAVAEDADAGTLHYVLLLPLSRSVVVLGKYLFAATLVSALMVGTTLLVFLASHLSELSLLGSHATQLARVAGAVVVASTTYSAIFILLGAAVADLPYLLSLLYVAVVEIALGALSFFQIFSVRHHVALLLGAPQEQGFLPTPEIPLWGSGLALGLVALLCLGLTALIAELSEFRQGKP